jgi:hypothetical protein
MMIQFNTDNVISGSQEKMSQFEALISEQLGRFSDHISRIEVHFGDENGHKQGTDDIRCMLEARLEGFQPVAVTNHAGDQHYAIKGALDKMKSLLDTKLGKQRNH